MNNPPHILVVDDEEFARSLVIRYFGDEGFRVSEAASGTEMRKVLARSEVDIVLLDVKMPGEDGLKLAREIVSTSDIPIIFVSGKDDDVDRIVGLELGAVDYVVKPFIPRELLARVRIALRSVSARAPTAEESKDLSFEDWSIDVRARTLTSPKGEVVRTTRAEFDLLAVFARNPGRALPRDELLAAVSHRDWNYGDRSIDVLVRRLRSIIEVDPGSPRWIVTVYGVGYIFTPDVTRSTAPPRRTN